MSSVPTGAGLPLLGVLDIDGAAADFGLVHSLDRIRGRGLLGEGHKPEPPAAASLAVIHHVGLSDRPKLGEHLDSARSTLGSELVRAIEDVDYPRAPSHMQTEVAVDVAASP